MIHAFIAALLLSSASPDPAALMKTLRIPGMEVIVVDRGKGKITDAAYGVKNLTTKQPVDLQTRFEIGSITKQFTAAAILQLKEQGKLSLDDTLGRYIPAYRAGRNITLRQMLLQISGIPNYTDVKAFGAMIHKRNGVLTLSEQGSLPSVLALIARRPLDFTPGSKWEYSNSNYYLLGRIVGIASGMPWNRYIARNVFQPAAMTESSFMENEAQIADMATGYAPEKNQLVPTGSFAGWAGGAGSIVSTAADLARWDEALLAGKIVKPADLTLMTSPGTRPALGGHYGFGWVIDTFDGQPRVWHNGGTLGFSASNQMFPAQSQIVIVLTNSVAGNADQVAQASFDQIHPDLAAAKNTPVNGEDPAVTQRIRTVWAQLIARTPDRAQFTAEANKAFTPAVLSAASAQLSSLGDPKTWVYRGSKMTNGMTTYAYRVTFSSGTALNVYMTVTKDQKIAGYFASPN